jgi:hypothetical protein
VISPTRQPRFTESRVCVCSVQGSSAPALEAEDDAASDGSYGTPRGLEMTGRQVGDIATEDSDLVLLGDTSPDNPKDIPTQVHCFTGLSLTPFLLASVVFIAIIATLEGNRALTTPKDNNKYKVVLIVDLLLWLWLFFMSFVLLSFSLASSTFLIDVACGILTGLAAAV